MNTDDFSKLIASIKQAGDIRRGTSKITRITKVELPDVPRIRGRLGLSQSEFALMIGVSPRTVQNWEQRRREPEGAARALLVVAERHPKMVLQALHG